MEAFEKQEVAKDFRAWISRRVNRNLAGMGALEARLAKGVFWSAGGAVIAQGLALLTSIFVARLLGPTSYGKLGILQSTIAMFAIFAGPSLGLTATKYVAELRESDPERAGRIIGMTSLTALGIGGVIACLLGFTAPSFARSIFAAPQLVEEVRVVGIALLLNGFIGVQTGTLAGFEAFRTIAKVSLWRGLLNAPLMLAGTWLGGLMGALVGLVIAAAIGVGINHRAIQHEAVRAHVPICYTRRLDEWRVLLYFSLPAFLAGTVVFPITWFANVLLVNQPSGYVQMGIFNAANQWRIALLFLPGIISQPVVPMLSDLYGKEELQSYRRVLRLDLMATLGVTLLPAGVIAAASSHIMSAYGAQFAGGGLTLIFLALSAVLSSASGIIGSAISSMGKMWHGFGLNCIWGAAFLIASIFLVKQGAQGLAMAYGVSHGVHLISVSLYVRFAMRDT